MIRTASAQALHDLTESGRREDNCKLILAMVAKHGRLTRREIEFYTGLRTNQVTGRVNELIGQKRLEECGMSKCSITGNVVNVVCLPEVEVKRRAALNRTLKKLDGM